MLVKGRERGKRKRKGKGKGKGSYKSNIKNLMILIKLLKILGNILAL